MPEAESSCGRFSFVTLGCAKNLVDSERMLGLMVASGFALVPESEPADLVIVNTCGFIECARQESMEAIRGLLDRKRRGEVGAVIVAGCLAEREKEGLLDQLPEVDQVVGVFGREEIGNLAKRLRDGLSEQRSLFMPAPVQAFADGSRLRITPRHLAYLKVSEGCDRLCTFCAIPYMRGKHVSKPLEQIVAEAIELAGDGVRELNLVAQDMTYYGIDLYGRPRLAELLRELDAIEDLDWIRLLYNYPEHVTEELIEVLSGAQRIIPYLDMPLQHINDRVLKLMNRRHTRRQTETILKGLRDGIPGLVLRTTFIVGFPGETEAEFEELLGFAQASEFERLGVFTYSFEPDTPAARLPNHLSEEEKRSRRDRLMESQQGIAFGYNASLVGQVLDVLIDRSGVNEEGSPCWLGRAYTDAPDVDGQVIVRDSGLQTGDLVSCEIVGSLGYDLIGETTRRPRRQRRRPIPRLKKSVSPFPIIG